MGRSITKGIAIFLFMIFFFAVMSFWISTMRVSHIIETSQNVLDVYTAKTGAEIVNSIKSGNDYTLLINETRFKNDFQEQLGINSQYITHDATSGKRTFDITNLQVNFVFDRYLKTEISYTLNGYLYFSGNNYSFTSKSIHQQSRYETKFY